MTALITIITPVYNAEAHLEQCLGSVRNQTFKDYEHLCVDDGSDDHSPALLDRYGASDHRAVIIHQHNAGAAVARNAALTQAKGEFYAFLDADDFVEPDWLEKLHEKAVRTNADIVIHPMTAFDASTNTFRPLPWSCQSAAYPDVFSWRDNPDKLFTSFHNWPCNKLFSAKLIRENDLSFQEVPYTEDLRFTCAALALADRITTVNEPLYVYRIGNPGSNLARNERAPFDFFTAHAALKRFLEERNLYEPLKRSYRTWTAESLLFQMRSYRQFETYTSVFSYLQSGGLEELDLTCTPECFDSEEPAQFVRSITEDELAEHLFKQARCEYAHRLDHEKTIDGLVGELNAYEASLTWKIGEAVLTLPKLIRRIASKKRGESTCG